jgi:mRNA-degrading endonuclease toxin of MazEF toxin-antitoxin module
MAARNEIRVGDIFWLENCPPLQGEQSKTRPVIVMSLSESDAELGGVLTVACTSSSYPDDTAVIELPSHPDGRVRSGLKKKTWVVLRWIVVVQREQLKKYVGYISGDVFDHIVTNFRRHYQNNNSRGGLETRPSSGKAP